MVSAHSLRYSVSLCLPSPWKLKHHFWACKYISSLDVNPSVAFLSLRCLCSEQKSHLLNWSPCLCSFPLCNAAVTRVKVTILSALIRLCSSSVEPKNNTRLVRCFSGWRCWPPRLITRVQYLGPKWQKKRTESWKLCSDFHMYVVVGMCMHIHEYPQRDQKN